MVNAPGRGNDLYGRFVTVWLDFGKERKEVGAEPVGRLAGRSLVRWWSVRSEGNLDFVPDRFVTKHPRNRSRLLESRVSVELVTKNQMTREPTMIGAEAQAVILAAGMGSRLGPVAGGLPKCLLEVGGRTLLQHHLAALNEIGIERVLIVVGHGAGQVMAAARHFGVLQYNEVYSQTNSLYSLWLARKWITGTVMVINSDVLASPQIYRRVLETGGNALAFDSGSGTEEEEMKVRFESGWLCAIGKEMKAEVSHGENLGILKFDRDGARVLMEEADRIVRAGGMNEWAPAAIGGAAKRTRITGVDVGELPWTEIDFPDDLEDARRRVWPAISGSTDSAEATINGSHSPVTNGHLFPFPAKLVS